MKSKLLKRILVFTLSICIISGLGIWNNILPYSDTYGYTEQKATVKSTTLNVRSGPGTTYSKLTVLNKGNSVTISDETSATDGATWCKISCVGGSGSTVNGYVMKSYLKTSSTYTTDTSFESKLSTQGFPESYKVLLREIHAEYPNWVFEAQNTGISWTDAVSNESLVGRNLVYKTSISSWKSIADGAYDWDTSSWPGFDSSLWVAASQDIISYYMDPRNFLDSTYVFQFLTQSYDSAAHNATGVESLVKNTFMESTASTTTSSTTTSSSTSTSSTNSVQVVGPGNSSSSETTTGTSESETTTETISSQTSNVSLEAPTASIVPIVKTYVGDVSTFGPGMNLGGSGSTSDSTGSSPSSGSSSYVDLIMSAAQTSGVNPYVLTAMIIQEQGTKGTSGLISGTTSPYTGIYNFFNIEAYQSGDMSAVTRGLWWASQSGSYGRPWSSVEKAISGGAQYYGDNYVKAGQDTFYLKKFNVQGSNIYKHQYMTNIEGAAGEAAKLNQAYSTDLKATALEFKIPIYTDMPDTIAACPTIDGSPNNKLSGLGVSGFSLTPTFNRDTLSYDLIVDSSVTEATISANALDSKASVANLGTVNLSSGNNTFTVNVTAENGTVRTYTINVVRQQNGPTYTSGLIDSSLSGVSTTSSSSGTTAGSSTGPGVSSSASTSTDNVSTSATVSPVTITSSSESGTVVLISPSGQ